jgi:hypothetical protein
MPVMRGIRVAPDRPPSLKGYVLRPRLSDLTFDTPEITSGGVNSCFCSFVC